MHIDNYIKEEAYMRYPNGFYQMDNRIFDRGIKPIPFAVYNYLVSCAGSPTAPRARHGKL